MQSYGNVHQIGALGSDYSTKKVFGHVGLYKGDVLVGWLGKDGLGVRPERAAEKKIIEEAGCQAFDSGYHKKRPYYVVPEVRAER